MMSKVYACGEYCLCWGDGGVQLYQGDEIVQHIWGGCGGVCHGLAVVELGYLRNFISLCRQNN